MRDQAGEPQARCQQEKNDRHSPAQAGHTQLPDKVLAAQDALPTDGNMPELLRKMRSQSSVKAKCKRSFLAERRAADGLERVAVIAMQDSMRNRPQIRQGRMDVGVHS